MKIVEEKFEYLSRRVIIAATFTFAVNPFAFKGHYPGGDYPRGNYPDG